MAGSAGDRGLGRRDRLRSRRDFERLARSGERRASRHFVVLVAGGARPGREDPGERVRLGVTASRRVGGSVVRNRVKRRMREVFRRRRGLLPAGSDVVVIARPGAGALAPGEFAKELETLLGADGRR